MRDRRHHYTTLTNASTGLRRQGEHSSLALTPARPADPNPYTRYSVLLSKFTQALMALL